MHRIILFLLLAFSFRGNTEVITAPMKAESWERQPTVLEYEGRTAFLLSGGSYFLKNAELKNGRITVDIFTPGQRGFVGIVFRRRGLDNELFYLRPHKSRLPDTIQYTPVFNGLSGWQLYHDERYLAPAEIPTDRWVQYKVEFINHELKIYVDGEPNPVLETTLKHDVAPGGIGIWGSTAGFFSNFQYEDLGTPSPAKAIIPQEVEAGVVTDWQLSQRYAAESQLASEIPVDAVYAPVDIEDQGFVNISRHLARGKPKALAYAKTQLYAEQAKRIKLWFGYSDEVTIFLNGVPQYQGNSTYNFRAPFALGLLDDDQDAIYLDLKKGNNELIYAVTEAFGGWGFMARIE